MSLAIPTSDKPSKEEWKKLVCGLFTGVKLYNNDDRLMLADFGSEDCILNILQEYTKWTILQTGYSDYIYLPHVTVLYQENRFGVIVGEVLSHSTSEHAEEQFLSKSREHLHSVHSIGLNYSPCPGRCADTIVRKFRRTNEEEALPKPVIHFSRVYNYKSKDTSVDGRHGIKLLLENGFNLKVLETTKMVHYLLEQAPSEILKTELRLVYTNMSTAFSERDMETQELIEEARKEINDEAQRREYRKRTALEEPAQKRPAADFD